jgi:hypothetical protein
VDIENLKKLARIVEKEKGKVHFFAVFERERRPGEWDILLSADGLLPGRSKSIGYVIDKLKPLIGGDKGMLEIGRVVVFDKDEHFVNEVRELLAWEKTTRIRNEVIGDVSVSRGYILKAPTKMRASSGTYQSGRVDNRKPRQR